MASLDLQTLRFTGAILGTICFSAYTAVVRQHPDAMFMGLCCCLVVKGGSVGSRDAVWFLKVCIVKYLCIKSFIYLVLSDWPQSEGSDRYNCDRYSWSCRLLRV